MRSQSKRALFLFGAFAVLSYCTPVLVAHCDSGSVCTCPDCPINRSYKQSRWTIVETENFQICCDDSKVTAESLAKHAECLRSELQRKWFGKVRDQAWSPKCQIVLHAKVSTYVSAVGRGSERTVGSSLIKVDDGKILSRKIDLLKRNNDFLSAALPHELTHVVLKERFAKTLIPRWADEGIAILADPVAKQGRHKTDLKNALSRATTFQAAALLNLEDYPAPDRFGVFYGQSASLAAFLINRKSPEEFIEFVERATLTGYDAALKSCYDISNVRELDRKWRENLALDSAS